MANVFEKNKVKVLVVLNIAVIVVLDLIAGWILIPEDHLAIEIRHPQYHHGFRPNRHEPARYGPLTYEMYTNSLGLRDLLTRDIPLKEEKRRILFMGDSFTEAVGMDFLESFVGRVASRLAPDGVDVLNAGVKGYSPKFYYLKTRYLVETEKLNIDELIVMMDSSDIPEELKYEPFEPHLPSFAEFRFHQLGQSLRRHSYVVYFLDQWNRNRTAAGTMPSPRPSSERESLLDLRSDGYDQANLGFWTTHQDLFDLYGKKGLELAEANMRKLVELCKENGIKMTLIVYPNANQVLDRDLQSIQERFWSAFANMNGITFIDLFPAFINESDPESDFTIVDEDGYRYRYPKLYIPGDVHWNSEGHRVAAEAILSHLSKNR